MKSPLDGVDVDPHLVTEFFAVFSRFEYAMKATRYCRADRYGNALPNWAGLANDLGAVLASSPDGPTKEAMAYLVAEPPLVQKCVDDQARWEPEALTGGDVGSQVIEASRRVRNNLFHGGKHTPHSPPGRNTRLMRSALIVLQTCLTIAPDLRDEYELPVV